MTTKPNAIKINETATRLQDRSSVMCFPNGRPNAPGRNSKNSNLLEKQAIVFTVVLYIFICASLLGFHYAAEFEIIPTTQAEQGVDDEVATSSSSSPYNPK